MTKLYDIPSKMPCYCLQGGQWFPGSTSELVLERGYREGRWIYWQQHGMQYRTPVHRAIGHWEEVSDGRHVKYQEDAELSA